MTSRWGTWLKDGPVTWPRFAVTVGALLAVQIAIWLGLILLWHLRPDWQDAIFYTATVGVPDAAHHACRAASPARPFAPAQSASSRLCTKLASLRSDAVGFPPPGTHVEPPGRQNDQRQARGCQPLVEPVVPLQIDRWLVAITWEVNFEILTVPANSPPRVIRPSPQPRCVCTKSMMRCMASGPALEVGS